MNNPCKNLGSVSNHLDTDPFEIIITLFFASSSPRLILFYLNPEALWEEHIDKCRKTEGYFLQAQRNAIRSAYI